MSQWSAEKRVLRYILRRGRAGQDSPLNVALLRGRPAHMIPHQALCLFWEV